MPSGPVRIAILNDYQVVVAGIAGVLAPYPDRVEVVELDSGTLPVTPVDLVLYDTFGQAQGDAADFERITADSGGRVVVYSWNTDRELVARAMAAGAAGYLPKHLSGAELVAALEGVHAGRRIVPARPAGSVGPGDDDVVVAGRWPGHDQGLSARESEVLALICQGLSNQQVADRAFLAMNTVKTYIRTLYRKIGADSRTQAVLWGLEHGFEERPRREIRGDG